MNTDYSVYHMTRRQKLAYYGAACMVLAGMAYLFYRSIPVALVFCFLSIPGEKLWTKRLCRQRQKKMLDEFRDVLCSLSSALACGLQLPDALEDASRNACFGNGDSGLRGELQAICGGYRSSHSAIDQMLEDLGRRSGLEDIASFAVSCAVCTECGGDLEAVTLHTVGLLLDRMDFTRELETMIAQKKMDIAILTSMPVLVLLFLNLTSSSYILPLYETTAGRLIMSLALLLIAGALLWSVKIIEIEI